MLVVGSSSSSSSASYSFFVYVEREEGNLTEENRGDGFPPFAVLLREDKGTRFLTKILSSVFLISFDKTKRQPSVGVVASSRGNGNKKGGGRRRRTRRRIASLREFP